MPWTQKRVMVIAEMILDGAGTRGRVGVGRVKISQGVGHGAG